MCSPASSCNVSLEAVASGQYKNWDAARHTQPHTTTVSLLQSKMPGQVGEPGRTEGDVPADSESQVGVPALWGRALLELHCRARRTCSLAMSVSWQSASWRWRSDSVTCNHTCAMSVSVHCGPGTFHRGPFHRGPFHCERFPKSSRSLAGSCAPCGKRSSSWSTCSRSER